MDHRADVPFIMFLVSRVFWLLIRMEPDVLAQRGLDAWRSRQCDGRTRKTSEKALDNLVAFHREASSLYDLCPVTISFLEA